jgi:hypothetical protein
MEEMVWRAVRDPFIPCIASIPSVSFTDVSQLRLCVGICLFVCLYTCMCVGTGVGARGGCVARRSWRCWRLRLCALRLLSACLLRLCCN